MARSLSWKPPIKKNIKNPKEAKKKRRTKDQQIRDRVVQRYASGLEIRLPTASGLEVRLPTAEPRGTAPDTRSDEFDGATLGPSAKPA
jgi:hypothetical protein